MNYAPFDEIRPKLEKQYENAVFPSKDCWDEAKLRQVWDDHKKENPDEDRILSRAFLISLILEHAPVAEEKFNAFPGKFQHFNLLAEDLQAGYELSREKVPGVVTWGKDMELGIGWMVDRSHVAPDWNNLMKLGLPGLIERAACGASPFHKAVVMVYKALAEFCRRVARINDNPVYAEIAEHCCTSLPS